MKKYFVFLLVFSLSIPLYSQYDKDIVWSNKTNQLDGFGYVKFSQNDSLIVAGGMEMNLFFDAKTGQEIKRIPGRNQVFFLNNDKNFIKLNQTGTKIEIFDIKSFTIIDSIENDSIKITGIALMSKNERYVVAQLQHGFRVWDIQTKKILHTKIYPYDDPNVVYLEVESINFSACENNNLVGSFVVTYQDSTHPGNPKYYTTYQHWIEYDLLTLDSIGNFGSRVGASNSCKYFAKVTGLDDYGVEIYEFNTKQLLWRLNISGISLTGIAFSPDDKYFVASNALKIWDLANGKIVYDYQYGSIRNFDLSHDSKFIITSSGRYLFLLNAFYGGASVLEVNENIMPIIYPNPTTGFATVKFNQPVPEVINIVLTNINGLVIKPLFNNFLDDGSQSINVNTSDFPSGSYVVKVQSQHLSLVFKLIINK